MMRKLNKRLFLVIFAAMTALLSIGFLWQYHLEAGQAWKEAAETVAWLRQAVSEREAYRDTLQETNQEDMAVRAAVAARWVDEGSLAWNSADALQTLADLLAVEAIHIFNEAGDAVSGYGPLERPEMIYATARCGKEPLLVQVGRVPMSILAEPMALESGAFLQTLLYRPGWVFCIVDRASGLIVASTDAAYGQQPMEALHMDTYRRKENVQGIDRLHNGEHALMAALTCDDYLFVAVVSYGSVILGVMMKMLIIFTCLLLVSVLLMDQIARYLEKTVLHEIETLEKDVSTITQGHLDTRVSLSSSPEFINLSSNINIMVETLVNNSRMLSKILDSFNQIIGYFSIRRDMRQVQYSDKLGMLLRLDGEEIKRLCEDKEQFLTYIQQLRQRPAPQATDVYQIDTQEPHYVKINLFENGTELIGIVRDMTEIIQERMRLRQERDHDFLTGVLVRRAFYEKLDALFSQPDELGHYLMMMLDLDHFKEINDTFGHAIGDQSLCVVAGMLEGIHTTKKLVSRFGGDEFLVFLYGASGREELLEHVQVLHGRMEQASLCIQGQQLRIRFSAGFSFGQGQACSYEEMLRHADEALDVSKKEDKGDFLPYEEKMEEGSDATLQ